MSFKKLGLFRCINILMVVVCIFTASFNFVNTKISSSQKAQSYIGSDVYNFMAKDNTLELSRNGNLITKINSDKKIKFIHSILPFQNDGLVILGKAAAAGVAAAATGGSAAAAIKGVLMGALAKIGGAAMSGAAVSATIPGEAAVAATVGGAGEIAAAAAAAESAALAGASAATILSTILVPMLIGAGIFAGVA